MDYWTGRGNVYILSDIKGDLRMNFANVGDSVHASGRKINGIEMNGTKIGDSFYASRTETNKLYVKESIVGDSMNLDEAKIDSAYIFCSEIGRNLNMKKIKSKKIDGKENKIDLIRADCAEAYEINITKSIIRDFRATKIKSDKAWIKDSNINLLYVDGADINFIGIEDSMIGGMCADYGNFGKIDINRSIMTQNLPGISITKATVNECMEIKKSRIDSIYAKESNINVNIEESMIEGRMCIDHVESGSIIIKNSGVENIDAKYGKINEMILKGVSTKKINLNGANIKTLIIDENSTFKEISFLGAKINEFKGELTKNFLVPGSKGKTT